jgi:ABC-type amino acid transport substrate-binding protein
MRLLALAVLALAGALAACELPRDPRHTLAQVRSRPLRVGVAEAPPWVTRDASGEPSGLEVEVVRELAAALGTTVDWRWADPERRLQELHEHRLDLVVAGLTTETPWKKRLGLTRPYFVEPGSPPREHVLAVPPGENAWLLHVERALQDRKARVAARLAEGTSP